jgi:hypothetical protein
MIERYKFEICGIDNAELMWDFAMKNDVNIRSLKNIRHVQDVGDPYYMYEALMTKETYLAFRLTVPAISL